jgi:hypothetical protein
MLPAGATVLERIVPNPEESPLPNLVFEYQPHLYLMISHQLEIAATDAEWDGYLAAMVGPLQSAHFRSIVVSEGAHPTRMQQEGMTSLMRAKPARVAVLSSASGVRFVVSMLALMNRNVKAFAPEEYEAAFTHVGLAPAEHDGVAGVIERLRERLDPPEMVTTRRRRSDLVPARDRGSQNR